jgi:tetratricopeptide (TPR) repeat protein
MSVNAQNDERALAAAVDTIVRKYTEADIVNQFVDEIFEKHRSAYLATRIAKSYYNYNENPETKMRDFHSRDTVQAFKYIRRSIGIDPKYAQAYVVASDILNYEKGSAGREEAMAWLNRGKTHNPQDSALYIASAEMLAYTDAEAAVAQLEDLRKQNPNFPVDLQLGRLYFKIFDYGGTAEERYAFIEKIAFYYGKADKEMLTKGDLGAYAMALQFTNNFTDCYEITTYALSKYPDDFGLNQFLLSSAVRMKKYDESIAAAKKLMAIDKARMSPFDFIRYGAALDGAKRYEDAIAQYNYVLQMENASDGNKTDANNQINNTIVNMCSEKVKLGEYNEAFAMYEKYIAERRTSGHLDAYLMGMYANAYIEQAKELNGEERIGVLLKADHIYDEMVQEIPSSDIVGTNFRFSLRMSIDGDNEKGLLLPMAEKLISLILSKPQAEIDKHINKLAAAYMQLMRYYSIIKTDKPKALEYADKILELDPTNSSALKIKEVFGKRR